MVRSNAIIEVYYLPTLVHILKGVECCTTILLLVAIIIYIKLLLSRVFCHRNLLTLLIFHPLTQWFSLLFRWLRHVLEATNLITELMVDQFNMWMDIFIAAAYIMMTGFAIERVVATVMVHRYEKMCARIPFLGLFLCVSQTFACLFLIVLLYLNMLNVSLIYTFEVIMAVVTLVFFATLPFLSRRAYYQTAKDKTSSVSTRYQTTQNVRNANMLKFLMPYICLSNDVSLLGYNWSFEWSESYYLPLNTQIYYLLVSCQLFFELVIGISSHPSLREEFTKMFFKSRVNRHIAPIEQRDIRSFTGNRLIYTAQEEKDMYFSAYQEAWK